MLASLFTSGCGQKGPLYKTPATEANRPAAAAEPAADTPVGQTQSQQQ
ncbi:LPS translocon maturation chaperone LptM [Shewanella salipaludis]